MLKGATSANSLVITPKIVHPKKHTVLNVLVITNQRPVQHLEKKCINCVRSDADQVDHHAYDLSCPAIIQQQEMLKHVIEKDSLNLATYTTGQTT